MLNGCARLLHVVSCLQHDGLSLHSWFCVCVRAWMYSCMFIASIIVSTGDQKQHLMVKHLQWCFDFLTVVLENKGICLWLTLLLKPHHRTFCLLGTQPSSSPSRILGTDNYSLAKRPHFLVRLTSSQKYTTCGLFRPSSRCLAQYHFCVCQQPQSIHQCYVGVS